MRPQFLSTFVAYDDASRGPLGSLNLLWKNQYWSNGVHISALISSLGAVIAIFILLLDPFSQQIIRTYQCDRLSPSRQGSIVRTNSYYDPNRNGDEVTVSVGMRRAIYSGLFSSQKTDVKFDCPTGKCNFTASYTSVAYCSYCWDALNELNFTQHEMVVSNKTYTYANVSIPIRLPERQNLTLSRIPRSGMSGPPLFVSAMSVIEREGGDLGMIRWDGDGDLPTQNQTIRAYRCRLYPCIKRFKSDVSTGQLREHVIEESGAFEGASSRGRDSVSGPSVVRTMADLNCIDRKKKEDALRLLKYEFNATTRWLPYDKMLVISDEGPEQWKNNITCPSKEAAAHTSPKLCKDGNLTSEAVNITPARCVYNYGFWDADAVEKTVFYQMFKGEVYKASPVGHYGGGGSNEAVNALYTAGSGNGTLKDIQDVISGMTDSMTKHIREAGIKEFSQSATGDMYESTGCIEVRWPWLSFAAVVVSLLLIFFAWTIIYAQVTQSQLKRQWGVRPHDYKSSALSTLFHGFDQRSMQKMESVTASGQERELSKSTKGVEVKLVPTDQGWKLSSVNS